ncbi:MAG: GGDEF domain-containing protein [Frankia sp.]|nr:GGDEF domain-containing protein [Frankia sp.]
MPEARSSAADATAAALPATSHPGATVMPGPAGQPRARRWPWLPAATVELAWGALVVVTATRTTFRLADLLTTGVLTGIAALVMAASRLFGTHGDAGPSPGRHHLPAIWILPIALLVPAFYALVAYLPVSLLAVLLARTDGRARRGWARAAQEAAAIGLLGAAASGTHDLLAAAAGAQDGDGFLGSPMRLAALAAAALVFALGRRLLLRRRGSDRAAAAVAVEAAELCSGATVATLWALNPLLMVVAAPPALLLQRGLRHDELLTAARTDAKTRLANAIWWRQVAEQAYARAERTRRPMSVLLVDIDHFKQINDRYGHLFGDTVLLAVVDALRAATRQGDLVGRFGGEEFVVALADVGLDTAAEVAERIRQEVAAIGCPLPGQGEVRVTVSVGVATCQPPGGVAGALEAADAALYAAKAAGRNRVRLATATAPAGTAADGTASGAPRVPAQPEPAPAA